jgi:hypothetical protein
MSDSDTDRSDRCYYCRVIFRGGKERVGHVASLSNKHGPPTDEEITNCSSGMNGPDGEAPHCALAPHCTKAHEKCCAFLRSVNTRAAERRGSRAKGLDERPVVLPPKARASKSAAEKAAELAQEGAEFGAREERFKLLANTEGLEDAAVSGSSGSHSAPAEPEGAAAAAVAAPAVVPAGTRKGIIDPHRRLDTLKHTSLLRVARQRCAERRHALAMLKRKELQHAGARTREKAKRKDILQLRKDLEKAVRELSKASARLDVFDEAAAVLGKAGLSDIPTLFAEAVNSGHVDPECIFARFMDDQMLNVFHATSYTHRFKGERATPRGIFADAARGS